MTIDEIRTEMGIYGFKEEYFAKCYIYAHDGEIIAALDATLGEKNEIRVCDIVKKVRDGVYVYDISDRGKSAESKTHSKAIKDISKEELDCWIEDILRKRKIMENEGRVETVNKIFKDKVND